MARGQGGLLTDIISVAVAISIALSFTIFVGLFPGEKGESFCLSLLELKAELKPSTFVNTKRSVLVPAELKLRCLNPHYYYYLQCYWLLKIFFS